MASSSKQLAHMVYFTIEDATQAKIDSLVTDCKTYLDNHPGLVYFSVGTLNPDLARPVNARDYHVALNVVFENREAHDVYQTAPRHIEFINRQKANWKQVRVYDSDLQ